MGALCLKTMTARLGKLKRFPSFTVTRRENGLKFVDPLFRFSLTRLVEATPISEEQASPGTEARFAAGWVQQFRDEWGRIREAVYDIFKSKSGERSVPQPAFTRGQLQSLHDDIHILQRSQAGTFIFEFYQKSLLPGAMEMLLERILMDESDLVANLGTTWSHFYCHALPALEAIFVQVKNHKMSIRQATLLAFRDHVVLKLESTLMLLLAQLREDCVPQTIKQMLLVLQSVCECYPPSEQRLRLEALVVRVISPYLGFRGLYDGGHPDPIVPSRELKVAHLRRPSVVDPRRLTRPLSVNSSHHLETLSDLFALSADRIFNRKTVSRETATTVW